MAEPPVGSASTSNTGRDQVNASPRAEVVTPGEPEADASTTTAILSAPGNPAPRRPCPLPLERLAPPPGRMAPGHSPLSVRCRSRDEPRPRWLRLTAASFQSHHPADQA